MELKTKSTVIKDNELFLFILNELSLLSSEIEEEDDDESEIPEENRRDIYTTHGVWL
jgi:hypothetical protein